MIHLALAPFIKPFTFITSYAVDQYKKVRSFKIEEIQDLLYDFNESDLTEFEYKGIKMKKPAKN